MAENGKEELILDPRFNIFEKYVEDKSVVACNIVNYYPLSQLSASASVMNLIYPVRVRLIWILQTFFFGLQEV
jgi:hypothetical protein